MTYESVLKQLEHARRALDIITPGLMASPGVRGLGVGWRRYNGNDVLCVILSVNGEVPDKIMAEIPPVLGGLPVVVETEDFRG